MAAGSIRTYPLDMVNDLSVMTWNVRYFGHGTGGLRTTELQIRRAAEAIGAIAPPPDVLALQEVETRSLRGGGHPEDQLERFRAHLHEALGRLGRQERYVGLHFPAHAYTLPGGSALYTTGLAFLVRVGIDIESHNADDPHDITHVRVSAFRRLKQRRIAAHVRLRPQGARAAIDLFNTHLSLPAFLEVGPHRVPHRMGHGSNQVEEVDRVLDLLGREASDRAVLMGDFNAAPGSPVYRALTHAGWVDAHAHHLGADLADLREHASARFMHLRMHLDHVFSTPAVRWRDFHAHRIDGPGPFRGLSDHAPKVGRLHLL